MFIKLAGLLALAVILITTISVNGAIENGPFTKASAAYFGVIVPQITDSDGNEIKLAKPDHEVIIKTLVANLADEYKGKRAITITEIRDENGVTLYLSLRSANSTSEGRINIDFSWTPVNDGLYFVRQFAITDLIVPEVLTLVESTTLIVLEKEDYQDNRAITYLANFSLPEIEILRNYTLKQAAELQQRACGRNVYGYVDLSGYLEDNNSSNDTSLISRYEAALPQKVKFAYLNPENPIFRQACSQQLTGYYYAHFFFADAALHSFPYEGEFRIHSARAAAEYITYVKYSSGGTGYYAVLSEGEYDKSSSGCGASELSPVKGMRITAYGDRFYDVELNVVDHNSGRFLYTEWVVPSNHAEESQLVKETTLGTSCGVI